MEISELHQERAREIVQRILYVTIATVTPDGRPWNNPVYSSFDNDGNFYWTSAPKAQHSVDIETNGRAFIVIYDSTVPEGTGKGVYLETAAGALSDIDEITQARRNLALRVGKSIDENPEQFLPGGIRQVYRATPHSAWVNADEVDANGNFVNDIRVEIPVETLKGLVNW